MNIAAYICEQVPCGRLVSLDEADTRCWTLYECPGCGAVTADAGLPCCEECGGKTVERGLACPECGEGALKPLYEETP